MYRPLATFALAVLLAGSAAADFKLSLPKRSKETPVQKLNRDGVKAVNKNDFEKAKKLFYRAYLLDPNDPFTLNNLGYIAELEGDIERAQRYYELAAENGSEAVVDQANNAKIEGKPVAAVAGRFADRDMQVNRMNVEAIGLLQKNRAAEADLLLEKALQLDRSNAYTLNNMGFAKEMQGELEAALAFYTAAANTNASDAVVVTVNRDWRGRPISEVARENSRNLQRELRRSQSVEVQVARLNLRGVSAMNRNERDKARAFFQQAYKLDPNDAFTLNNMGFLAETEGDRETAEYYYARAMEAERAGRQVGIATKREVEGRELRSVADSSANLVTARLRAEAAARRRAGVPVALRTRDGAIVTERQTPLVEVEEPAPATPQPQENQELLLPPGVEAPADPREQQQQTPQQQTPDGLVLPPGQAPIPDPREQQQQTPQQQTPQQQPTPQQPSQQQQQPQQQPQQQAPDGLILPPGMAPIPDPREQQKKPPPQQQPPPNGPR